MKFNLFSTGLITLVTLLSVKSISLVYGIYTSMQPTTALFASSSVGITSEQTKSSTEIKTETIPNNVEQNTSKLSNTKVIINNKVVPDYSEEDLKIFESLSQRSKDLDQHQENLEIKEATLTAIENKINQKIQQLSLEHQELQKAATLQKQKQSEEIKSLANIYSNMKPKDAAAIFNDLDMPLLIQIVGAMKERNVAQIVALMNHTKVKDLSIELARSGSLVNKSSTPKAR